MIEAAAIQFVLGTPATPEPVRLAAQQALALTLAGRAYPGHAPQETDYPYLIVSKSGADHKRSLQGPTKLCGTVLRLEAYHPLYSTAETIADQLRRLLDGYRGWLGQASPGGGFFAQAVFQDDDDNQWSAPVHADEQGVEAVELRLRVFHAEL